MTRYLRLTALGSARNGVEIVEKDSCNCSSYVPSYTWIYEEKNVRCNYSYVQNKIRILRYDIYQINIVLCGCPKSGTVECRSLFGDLGLLQSTLII